MAATRDVVLIGGGHNGLVTAFDLARAGFRPLVLERRNIVGGAAITEEFFPGFRCSTLAHCCGPLDRGVAKDMQLERAGLTLIRPEPSMIAVSLEGRALRLFADPAKSAQEIAKFSKKDADKYVEFCGALGRAVGVLRTVLGAPPPSIDHPSAEDMWNLVRAGRGFRSLGRKEMFRLLRWAPMAVADLAAEWFESELLRATIAAPGIFGTALGPRSAGTGMILFLRAAADGAPASPACFPQGGMGALTQAMAAAAMKAGAEIRTGAEVAQILVKDEAAVGVVLADGEEISAKAVVSNADPQRTLLRLVGPTRLEPEFVVKMQHYRCPGTVAKVNLALSGLPRFMALDGALNGALGGRIHIGPEIDYLERAFDDSKYGDLSRRPYLDVLIPSAADPSLAPEGRHIMSVHVQYAPFRLKQGDWASRREELGDVVVKTLAEYAPNLRELVLHRQVITPQDLECEYGLTGGHIFHGELALDQLFTMRPLLGWARYRTPIRHLYLCGSGTHPGIGLTGLSGRSAGREILKDLR